MADDEVFCFTYEDNIKLLQDCGAEIVRFSPVHDKCLPEGAQGLILSGGYPELYAEALSENHSMLEDIRSKLSSGLPCMAECGGFMYLNREIEGSDGKMYPMVGLFDSKVVNKGKLTRFGYIELESKGGSTVLPEGCKVKAHEFHYWDSEDCGENCIAERASNGTRYDCMHLSGGMVAGFPHLYYNSNPDVAYNFVKTCSEWDVGKK